MTMVMVTSSGSGSGGGTTGGAGTTGGDGTVGLSPQPAPTRVSSRKNFLPVIDTVYSVDFKRQVVLEFLGGETLLGLSKRHDISRNLIRLWVAKYEAGEFDEEAEAADLLQQYEAKITALERLVGRQALEIDFLKGTQENRARPKNGPTFAITGPSACPSPRDVN